MVKNPYPLDKEVYYFILDLDRLSMNLIDSILRRVFRTNKYLYY